MPENILESFRFYSPLWFLAAPLALVAVWRAWNPRKRDAAVFSSLSGLKGLPVTFAQRVRRLFPAIYAIGLLLLIAGLARPQKGVSGSRYNTDGVAIELVLDISGSMEARDFQLNGEGDSRINAVKHVMKQFVVGSKESGLGGRPDDLIGLVAFGGFADSKCPLTLDHGALLDIIQSLEVPKPIRDKRRKVINAQSLQEDLQTAIGDGLTLGIDRLRNCTAKSKVLVLMTDGDNTAGIVEPLEAAKMAPELGIKIYSIGVGKNGMAPFPQEDAYGHRVLVPQRFKIDEKLLQEIADIGKGKYFNVTNTDALTQVYSEIDSMEKSKVEETRYTEYTELYHWLVIPSLALLIGVGFLNATRFRALP